MRLLRTAFGSLMERKVRSLLTMLGIIIGVAAVYAMLAIGNGARAEIMENLGGINTRTISLSPDWSGGRASNRRPWRPFTEDDINAIRDIPGVESVSGHMSGSKPIVVPGTDWESDIRGTDQDYVLTNDIPLAIGRNLLPEDLDFSRTVAVLGKTTAERLFPKAYPIGAMVVIDKVPFEVVGVLDEYEPGWSGGRDANDFVLVPRTTARSRLLGGNWLVRDNITTIRIVGEDSEALTGIEVGVDGILRRSRNLSAADAPDFRIFNFSANRQQAAQGQQIFTILLASMGSIALIVGGVGVMNIMLVSVAERTREIGLRMSVGARRSDILRQFLVEAIVLCSLGGLIGLALGYGASEFAASQAQVGGEQLINIKHTVPTAALAFGSALFTGVVFGFLPARRASRLNPVEALRHD